MEKKLNNHINKFLLVKSAIFGIPHQMPTHSMRDLTPEEEERIAEREKAMFPLMGQTDETPIEGLMSSPKWTAAGKGALGLLGGGLLGGIGGLALSPAVEGMGPKGLAALGTALGGGIGATGMGLLGHSRQSERNRRLKDVMRRLPINPVKRDLLRDPVYGAEIQRATEEKMQRILDEQRRKYENQLLMQSLAEAQLL